MRASEGQQTGRWRDSQRRGREAGATFERTEGLRLGSIQGEVAVVLLAVLYAELIGAVAVAGVVGGMCCSVVCDAVDQ